MKVHKHNRAITLVEICVGAVILSLVMGAVMRMFVGGLKGSKQGMAHLTNMQTAAIVMAQIEYDLHRATRINDPAVNSVETAARWQFVNEDGTTTTVIYNLLPDGLERQENNIVSGLKKHTFGKGLSLKLLFRHLEFTVVAEKKIKEAMWVDLKVATDKDNNEEFYLRRMVTCRNLKREIF